jgi:hypothetical protein
VRELLKFYNIQPNKFNVCDDFVDLYGEVESVVEETKNYFKQKELSELILNQDNMDKEKECKEKVS